MIETIAIRDFTIIDQVELDLAAGMTALTGETGAGKSILLDAIKLVLGDRADSDCVKQGSERADINVTFDTRDVELARNWLQLNDYDQSGDECIIRRVVQANGRSKAFINGIPSTLTQLRELGELLVDLHGQHEHQSLLKPAVQLQLLDSSMAQPDLLQEVKDRFQQYRETEERLIMARDHSAEKQRRIDLLQLYCTEFRELNLKPGESTELNNEYQRLSHAGQIMQTMAEVLDSLFDAETFNVQQQLSRSLQQLEQLCDIDGGLQNNLDLIQSALIQVQEASADLHAYQESIDLDPARLEWLNQRLGQVQILARKHQIDHEGDELVELAAELEQELAELTTSDQDIEQLQALCEQFLSQYLEAAKRLSVARRSTADELSIRMTAAMQELGMSGGEFSIKIDQQDSADRYRASGIDQVRFLISANPGQSPRPLSKVASGGELSRMSLAIQVILSQSSQIPTLIFDEVDSGIGGGIAEVVGRQLRAISKQHQVLCVTHLPQVASQAHHHLQVIKEKSARHTLTRVQTLSDAQRLEEIARMLGGMTITDQTRAHAEEMLQRV